MLQENDTGREKVDRRRKAAKRKAAQRNMDNATKGQGKGDRRRVKGEQKGDEKIV